MAWAFRCGVLTVEIEHVDVATLQKLEQLGVDCQPKASTIRIIQVLSRVSILLLFLAPEPSMDMMIH